VRTARSVQFRIEDAGQVSLGKGTWSSRRRAPFDPNGRGIALARARSFSHVEYQGSGNIVLATIDVP